jgi:hypothetical protein
MKGKLEGLTNRLRKDSTELPDTAVEGILRVLESVQLQEMTCAEVFAALDEYVERELKDHEAARVMPLLREHFDMCPDCCEEYEALLEAVERSADDSGARDSGTNGA